MTPSPLLIAQSTDDTVSGSGSPFASVGWAVGALPGVLLYGFMIFMAIHAARARQWAWLAVMIVMPFSAIWYFLNEYRSNPMRGFELPGAADRSRAKRLEREMAQCDFDRPDLVLALGEVRFRQGKLAEATELLKKARASLPKDADAASLYGQALMRSGKAEDSLPHLRDALAREPRHGYGYTRMAYAEALTATGRKADAEAEWRRVLDANEYDRAKVQLAELSLEKGDKAKAAALVEEVLRHAKHGSTFRRKGDRMWVRRAKSLRRRIKR